MSKVLAIDVGEKRVGMAISDELGVVALPIAAFDFEGSIEEIKRIVEEENIERVVLGWPREMTGKVGIHAQKVKEFEKDLKSAVKKIKIDHEDETGTSLLAKERLRKRGVNFRLNKGRVDAEAAAIILESYLRND